MSDMSFDNYGQWQFSPSDFNLSVNLLHKYSTEVRKDVDQFLANASPLTRLLINSVIMDEYHSYVKNYQLDEFKYSTDLSFYHRKVEAEGLRKTKTEVVNLESVLPIIHDARVLQIQLRHILPILEDKKASGEVAKTSDVKVGDEISKGNENKTNEENDESRKINKDDGNEKKVESVPQGFVEKGEESLGVNKSNNNVLKEKTKEDEKKS